MFYFCATRFMCCIAATACTNSFVLQWVVGTRNSGQGRAGQGRMSFSFAPESWKTNPISGFLDW